MSDATFPALRLGRVGTDGKPRQLHLAEALESTDFAAGLVDPLKPDPRRADRRRNPENGSPIVLTSHSSGLRLNGPTTVGRDDRVHDSTRARRRYRDPE